MSLVFEEQVKFLMVKIEHPQFGQLRFNAASNTLEQYTSRGWMPTPMPLQAGVYGLGAAIVLGGAGIVMGEIVKKIQLSYSSSASTNSTTVATTYYQEQA